ncbi:beta-lactamase family protein, partial [Mycolicibacterium hippocampi]|uniref:beta-lactamase family protein n=1 Tax=Mycolicibacterium hippocampi TaxID=659824 RepID=UPI0021F2B35B
MAVYRNGRKVVDLWGGYRDGRTRVPWRPDTVVVATATAGPVCRGVPTVAASRGLLDYDARRWRWRWPPPAVCSTTTPA